MALQLLDYLPISAITCLIQWDAPMSFVRRVSELGRSWLMYHPNPCGILLGGLAYAEPIILFTTIKLLLTHIVWADQTGCCISFIFPKPLKLCHPKAVKWKGSWLSRFVVQWKCRLVIIQNSFESKGFNMNLSEKWNANPKCDGSRMVVETVTLCSDQTTR